MLGLIFLEVVAFYGVYLNLVVYLQDVLHGDSASNAAAVNFWAAASYLMPVVGVAVADSFWGKYKTVLVGFSTALIVSFVDHYMLLLYRAYARLTIAAGTHLRLTNE